MRAWLSAVIERPVSVGMLTLAAVVFGLVSFSKLPIELLPEIAYPSLTVQTELPDAAPEEVEQLVTDRIEPVVGVVSGLERYHSVSRAGVSEITLEFGWDTDMGVASLDVREKLDLVELPDDARSPVVFRFDPSLDPVLRVALLADVPIRELRQLAEGFVKQRLETATGVAAAKVVGGAEEEVRIELDEGRITALGLTIEEVASRVAAENVNRSGGELRDAETAYILRTIHEYETLDDIENTIIRDAPEGGEIRLREIGRVVIGHRDEEVRVRVGGVSAVELHIYKEGDANSVAVARAVRERLTALAADRRLAGIEPRILFDQARYIEESVSNVKSTALLGALLASIVLFFFLRDLLSTLIIALSIPISVTVTFLCMRFANISINVMSLGGLALGIGMLVDNSVVVLEAVRRRREQGMARVDAVINGTSEVFGGVVASTLTTISVFLPLIFVEGVAGQIFRDQALVVTFSLIASLFVAVTLIPSVLGNRISASDSLVSRTSRLLERPLAPLLWSFKRGVEWITGLYARALKGSLVAPWMAPLCGLVLFVAIAPRVTDLGSELVPNLFQGEFFYELELAEGTPIDVTDDKVRAMESAIARARTEHDLPIKNYYVTVGGTPVLGDVRAGDRREHIAQVHVQLEPGTSKAVEEKVIALLGEEVATIPECHPTLGRPTLFSFRAPIEAEVFSDDLDVLRTSALEVAHRLSLEPGFADVESGVADRSPEVHIVLDPRKLAAFGLTQSQVAQVIADKGLGTVASQYTQYEKPIDIRVLVDGIRRGRKAELSQLAVRVPGEGEDTPAVPLSALGQLREGEGPVEIRHVDGERAATVTARLEGRDLGSAAKEVERILESGFLPPTASARLSGQHEEMRASMSSLLMALSLAIFLVYLVLASSFESLRLPFVIILTVPLGLIGAVGALWLTSSAIGVIALIGVILLSGIVVNNGIIFVARTLQHRESGLDPKEAARRAGEERLRPILITSTTTILGLLPLALGIGAGAELRQPLAITVVGGLIVATVLTLFIIPSGYVILGGKRSTPVDDTDDAGADTAEATA